MNKLVIATNNQDKLKEIRSLLNGLDLEIIAASELAQGFDVVEDKDTILGNAAKKAVEAAQATGLPALADDTGLFIDALNGEPGVYAARFAGENCSYADNRNKALQSMQIKENRHAEFRTVVVLADKGGVVTYREGIVEGSITYAERGDNGFGYDAIFEVNGTGKTYAEMDYEEKNACSHRGNALRNIIPHVVSYFTNLELLRG